MRAKKFKSFLLNLLENKEFILTAVIFSVVFIILFLNSNHERYPDEFDNILGGKYLISGNLIYKDWFSHHGPLPYFVSAVLNIFSFNSFVNFRHLYALFLFLLTGGSYLFIRSRLKDIDLKFYLFLILLISIASTYFWGHMLLADNLSAYLILPVFGLIILKVVNKRKMEIIDYLFISIFSFLALMSSLTFSFLVAGIYLFLFIYYFVSERRKSKFLDLLKIFSIMISPFLIFVLYLLITGSLKDYFSEAFLFNRNYYIYYPGWEGKPPSNPIRYALLIAQGFHNNYSSLLLSARDFNFAYPFNITLAIGNLSLAIYLLIKRKYLAFLLVLGTLIYANARTNPLESRETDYQSAVYILVSMFNLTYAIELIYKELNLSIEYTKKLILSLVFIVLITYTFFNVTFLFRKFSYVTFNRYMGKAPGIFDAPKVSPFMNRVVGKDGYAWIGPFSYEDLYYLNTKLPSKYQVFLPGIGKSDQFQNEMLSEFNENKPELIYFDKDFYILGASPKEYGQPFLDFLNNNYIFLSDLEGKNLSYSDSIDKSLRFDDRLYINKEKANEVIMKMQKEGYVKE